jgi:antirestriction protein ArdC
MKAIEKIVDLVIEGLENGAAPWRKTWRDFAPMNAFSQREYNGFNILLLSFWCGKNKFSHPLFGTYKQIADAGGNVKKGEKSCPVIYWKIRDEAVMNDETGEEETEKRFTPFYYNVFNLHQAEGIDIEKLIPKLSNKNNNPLETCETVVHNMPNPPEITHDRPGAFYAPYNDMVNVPEIRCFGNSEEYYATTFHELAHSTGHSSRLNRFQENDTVFGKNSYDFEELVAEITATLLCSHCGIEQTVENSVSYLTGWAKFLKENRKSTLFSASTKAQIAASYILGKPLEFEQTERVIDYREAV